MVSLGLKIASVVLFALAVPPMMPYSGSLLAAGLACFALAEVVAA